MNRWTHAEDSYLATNFATATMTALTDTLDRTRDAVYSRAKILGLRRENRGKLKGFISGTPFRKGQRPWNTSLRDAVIKEFTENAERTVRQLRAATGSSASAIWKACARLKEQNNIHVCRWQGVKDSTGNIEAVYRIGAGVDAVKPEHTRQQDDDPDPHEIQPIPRPVLGAWGCVWNTTTPASPAERITP